MTELSTHELIKSLAHEAKYRPVYWGDNRNLFTQAAEQLAEKEAQIKGLATTLEILTDQFNSMAPGRHDGDSWASPHIEGECDECIYGGLAKAGSEALSTLPASWLERHKAERVVLEIAKDWEAMPNMTNEKLLVERVKALKEMESK